MVLIWNALSPFCFINPVATLLIVISFVIMASCILQEPSPCMSLRGLATQVFVFTLLSVSWLLRVPRPLSDMPAYYDSPFVENY